MSVIRAEEISFAYSTESVLSRISFVIESARMVALIGPNGSGKSTLLKMMNGTLGPQNGKMLLDGRKTTELSRREIAKKVAIVPQETTLTFPFYAEEIVLTGRFPHLGRYQFEDRKDFQIVKEAMEKPTRFLWLPEDSMNSVRVSVSAC